MDFDDTTGAPVADGYYTLIFLQDPFSWGREGEGPPSLRLYMKDYRWFRQERVGLRAKHVEGHLEFYPWHNLLYAELRPNSEEYLRHLEQFRTREARGGA